MFEMSINLGTVLEIISIVGSVTYFVWRMQAQLIILTTGHQNAIERLDKIDNKLDKLSNVVVDLARQEERMTGQDGKIQELANRVIEILKLMPPPAIFLPSPRIRKKK